MTISTDVQNLADQIGVLQTEVSALSAQTVNLLGSVNYQKDYLTSNSSIAVSSATSASTNATAAANSASAAASSATAAASARAAAVLAWQASTSPAETLAAVATQFHTGGVVDAFLYDTSKDSDGGAWRKRCMHTTWYNEAVVPGRWLGYYPSTPAVAAAGAQVGDYYQHVDGFFYQITQVTPSVSLTPVTRGNTREFPAVALIVVEAARVIIYDATTPTLAMWMVFASANTTFPNVTLLGRSVVARQTAVAMNAELFIGSAGAAEAMLRISFIDERAVSLVSGNTYVWPGTFAQRNTALTVAYPNVGINAISGSSVSDLAICVAPDAPISPATGLPMPTVAMIVNSIAIAVIKDFAAPVTLTITNNSIACVALHWPYVSFDVTSNTSHFLTAYDVRALTSHTISTVNSVDAQRLWQFVSPSNGAGLMYLRSRASTAYNPLVRSRSQYYSGDSNGLAMLRENPRTPLSSMAVWLSHVYNTGWMVGDTRAAFLIDTVAETISASVELVSNGTFDTNTTGWTAGGDAAGTVVALSSGALSVTAPTGAVVGWAAQQLTGLVVGRTYLVSVDLVSSSGANRYIRIGTGAGNNSITEVSNAAVVVGTNKFSFVATATSHHISVCTYNGQTCVFDNISVKRVEADRSGKAVGTMVYGTITKAAIATGAQTVAYSGFSDVNYLEQAYSANLDFGTGDFSIAFWALGASTLSTASILRKGDGSASNGFHLYKDTTTVSAQLMFVSNGATVSSSVGLNQNKWYHIVIMRTSGVLTMWMDGVQVYTGAHTSNLSCPQPLQIGKRGSANTDMPALALMRISATAPSADQIAQMYRDELPMLAAGAQVTLDGGVAAVAALSYDDLADIVHANTTWGRSSFRGLVRVDSSATSVGTPVASSAASGAHITAGSGGARFVQPAAVVRDELRRKDQLLRASARDLRPYRLSNGDGATTAFALPYGVEPVAVFVQGALKLDLGVDYAAISDGYRWYVVFNAAPAAGNTISAMGARYL